VKDGASHRIYAYAVNIPSGSNPLLAGSPRSIQCSSNDAGFVSQDVPNPMCIGQTYPVRVTMKNTGSSTWTAAANYRLGSQNPQDNTIWGIGRVDLLPVDAIAPMQNKDFVFSVSAPSYPGNYNFQWRMLREGVEWFGQTTPNIAVTVNRCTTTTIPSLPDLTVNDIYFVDEYGNKLPDPALGGSVSRGNLFAA